jgi:hypothetical protein
MNNKLKIAILSAIASLSATQSYANFNDMVNCTGRTLSTYTLDCRHWYVAGNVGVSHLYDNHAPSTGNSVDENGPGWDATLGYQWNSILGGELGYTQYYNSRETSGTTVVAKTTHFAVHANATGRYPLAYKLSALGKLGLAYSYAQKVFEATGAAASSGAVSPYLGLGLDYSITPTVDMLAQWSFVRGNNYTGSSTLYSLGMAFAIT